MLDLNRMILHVMLNLIAVTRLLGGDAEESCKSLLKNLEWSPKFKV